MSHGAKPVIAAAFGVAVLLTAGIAVADCGPSHKTVSLPQAPSTDTVAKPPVSTPGSTRG
ncbi:hypothetical protein [Azospirillum sp. TSO22-1]|uniref:hypothetical protein n=1 Tax=Azospirillum sp. TSO22-1 TaxID=716789 RepID=UPI000D617D80|nr:hypothetical protein [Azospirillum sp. TSO22-1]PWC43470.1 hypothetical protein TSO221_20010 [Azospirillum sp. TSO22-1]